MWHKYNKCNEKRCYHLAGAISEMPRAPAKSPLRGFRNLVFLNRTHHGHALVIEYAGSNSIDAGQKVRSENVNRTPLGNHVAVVKHDKLIAVAGGEIQIVDCDECQGAP